MNRENGGLYGSWSWSDTNFHKGDVPDLSYTDPMFKPQYSLENVPEKTLAQGRISSPL